MTINRNCNKAWALTIAFALTTKTGKDTTCKALSTLATIVAEFGDYSRRIRRLSPKTATVAEFGDKLSPFPATIVVSVDRA